MDIVYDCNNSNSGSQMNIITSKHTLLYKYHLTMHLYVLNVCIACSIYVYCLYPSLEVEQINK